MKRKISRIVFGILFLIGFLVMAYPTIANQWNTYRQSKLITNYESTTKDMKKEDFESAWTAAENYNNTFQRNNIYADVFGTEQKDVANTEYWNVLNVNGDGVMGYVTIPKIDIKLAVYHGTSDKVLQTGIGHLNNTEYWNVLNVNGDGVMGYVTIPKIDIKLAVYHGTSDKVLQTGIGHLNGTKLPIGGENTHSVLSAHRGLPSAKLFTDIDKLEKGDLFYIHVLDKDLAYEVDQILPMVDKDDQETLSNALQIEEGKDLVTLFTCTPYGVNTHRLLVRGHRVPYQGELEKTPVDTMVQAIQNYYMLYLLLGLSVTILVILLMKHLLRSKKDPAGRNMEEGKK